ncbi:MAG: TlpA family protein disulfide reductase [Jatrophihabitans sp.]|uniref:TlpA family protein disulfide reductase n=1 Tax=Jatrophihabitans sp. TaxID=1932789 RepID=UPI0039120921
MKRALLTLAAAVLALSACTGKDAVDQSGSSTFQFRSGTALGKLYPESGRKLAGGFTGKLLEGGTTTLAQRKGKVVVINFWATWCGPCKTETPQFDAVYRTIKARGVDFLGVDTKDVKSNAQSFVKTYDITYPIVFDEQGETALRLGQLPAAALPFTVLVDKQGKVAAVYIVRLSPKDLTGALDQLLAER